MGGAATAAAAPSNGVGLQRLVVRGKFLFAGHEKVCLRGVTYGTFRPDEHGDEFPPPPVVAQDFEQMAASGVNAVRTYTAPPARVLDAAERAGLRVMVGLGAERSIGYLNDRGGSARIEEAVRRQVRGCAGHGAVLCYTVGNEIPAAIVRWFGPRRIERLLARLIGVVRAEDPGALVTYANYPSTEYLELPLLDLVAFNVYLEDRGALDAYIARLQNIAGERPLVMTELGLDSLRHGEDAQAASVETQVRTAFAGGCAGAFVYGWTDEWHRGGEDVHDWAFGLTRRDREPKPALAAASAAFADWPLPERVSQPRASVIVCTRNGAAVLPDCLAGVLELDYPEVETIVVDDGSSDATATIARAYPVRVISTAGHGLSDARNRGLQASTGEIVAFLDDDARPDPHWLTYLAATLMTSDHAGVGGPNVAPPGEPPIAECVDKAPGIPSHVLLSDRVAEHIPGCNMAFRRERLEAIDGFDPQFRIAGDDVDVCWRLQEQGWTLGFSPAAVVFHRRRDSVRRYLKQQFRYGQAEALLERKWPEKFNGTGHLAWLGRLYAGGVGGDGGRRHRRIQYGTWGAGLFQSLYTPRPGTVHALARSPEWYLVIAALAALCALAAAWRPLVVAAPALAFVVAAPVRQSMLAGARATFRSAPRSRGGRLRLRAITALLHLLGPAARLSGRLAGGLTPFRGRGARIALPRPRNLVIWSERWNAASDRLCSLEADIRRSRVGWRRGGAFDRWDLEVRAGTLACARLRTAVEEHAGGAQLVRVRVWPRWSPLGAGATVLVAALTACAAADRAWVAAGVLATVALVVLMQGFRQSAAACGIALEAIEHHRRGRPEEDGAS